MADVARPVSLAEQIRLVAKLRWRILINGLHKKNKVLDLIGMIFVSLLGAALVIGPCFLFGFAGYSMVSGGRLQWLALPFWVIFIFWQVVPVFAVGFGTKFDFRSLLRFPFDASAFYLIGLTYGFADFPALAAMSWLLSLTVGATAARPGLLPILLAVVPMFVVLNVTLERLIGSWLEKLLARRRTRELFFALFILSMFSLQFIGPIQIRLAHKGNPATLLGLVKYLSPFPPSLAARAIEGSMRHDGLNIAVGLGGLAAFTLLFTVLLWRRFAAQYHGEELSESAAPGRDARPRAARAKAISLPVQAGAETGRSGTNVRRFLPPMIGAIVSKEFSYLLRNGFAFLLLILPPAQVLLFSSQFGGRRPFHFGGKGLSTDFLFPGMMAYTILVLMGPAYNAFAYESRGIQTYFTAPLKFADIFAGKNIVTAATVATEVLICGAVLGWRIGWPSAPTLVATLFALTFTVAAQLPIANWASLSFPRKLEFGSMRSQRNSGVSVWLMFGAQIVMGAISALVLWTARLTGNPWLAAEAFAFLAAVAFGGYLASLQPLSEFAEKKKETLIEALCR
jgi:ABC-2 type transport system permease protein